MSNDEQEAREHLVQEVVQRSEALKKENSELTEQVARLRAELQAKDNEKHVALKRQQALMKELKKLAQEERRRADAAERIRDGIASYAGSVNGERTDEEKSVSSMSVLESDNHELIVRLADLQRNHGEAMQRLRHLETANTELERENREKGEVIEHWIRSRPAPPSSASSPSSLSSNSPRSFSGGLKRFIGVAMGTSATGGQGDAAVSDIMEMNKKLQRLLEETLSKNLILQRDLQTLLERTEM